MRPVKILLAVAIVVAAGGWLATPATTAPDGVGVCHATGSDRHPYIFIEVDENSTDFEGHRLHADDQVAGRPPDLIEGYNVPAGSLDDVSDCVAPGPPTTTTEAPTTTEPPTTEPPTTEPPGVGPGGVGPGGVGPGGVLPAEPQFTG